MLRKFFLFSLLFYSFSFYAFIIEVPFKPKIERSVKDTKDKKEMVEEENKYVLTFDRLETLSENVFRAVNNVRFEGKDILLTCDVLIWDRNNDEIHAEGNVTVDFKDFTISGDILEYDLKEKKGEIINALGVEKEGEFTVIAKKIKKIKEDWYQVEEGIFTSCNAITPPWSLSVKSGKVHINNYAYIKLGVFKIKKMPIILIPYIIWPVKPDRSSGFLLPSVGNSTKKGFNLGFAYFLAPCDYLDTTFYYDYFKKAGDGIGIEFRYALTPKDFGYFSSYYIDDKTIDKKRWMFNTYSVGKFKNGFDYTVVMNLVSDSSFNRDFERDYFKGSRGSFDSFFFLTKDFKPLLLNILFENNINYYSLDEKLTDRSVPKVEVRVPQLFLSNHLRFSLETSFTSIERDHGAKSRLDYHRFDFHPFFEFSFFTPPYIDIIPTIEMRGTYYSENLEKDDDLRKYINFKLLTLGPKLYKNFKEFKVKHVIEPFLETKFESISGQKSVFIYDEIDYITNYGDYVKYGIRNRFYKDNDLFLESEISQIRNFDIKMSSDGERDSYYSPLFFSIKYWPRKLFSVDLKFYYHPVTRKLEERSLSLFFSTYKKEQFIRISYYYQNFPELKGSPLYRKVEEVLLNASLRLVNRKITVEPYISRDLINNEWQNLRIIFWYHGSCFNLGFEGGRREIGFYKDTSFRFLVSLKQVGNVVDLFGGSETYSK